MGKHWLRRIASMAALTLLTLLLYGGSPLWLVIAAMVDVLRKRSAALRTLCFFALYLGCELVGIAASFGAWIASAWSSHQTFLAWNFRLQCWWARTLRRGAFRIFSMRSHIEGAELCTPGPLLFFIRHCSVADTMLPVMLVTDPHRIVLRWVLKKELLWDPCLDIVGNRLRNCFVSRLPDDNAVDVAAVGALIDDLGDDEGVVIYPEGTRYTPAKRQRLIDKQHPTAAAFHHVLPPRLGGPLELLARNHSADVLFCAHSGLEGTATFWDLVRGDVVGATVRIKLWRVSFEDVPTSREERIAWLHSHWSRVDAFVGERPV